MLLRTFEVFERTISGTKIVTDEIKDWLKRNAWNKSILYVRLYSYESIHTFCSEWICKRCFLKHLKKGFKIQNLEFRLNSRKEFNRPPFWLGEKKWFEFCYHVHKSYLLESITGPRVAQLKYDAVKWKFLGDQSKIFKMWRLWPTFGSLQKTKDINDGCT